MKYPALLILFIILSITSKAQQVGDTIMVPVFNYESTSRDTLIQFPDGNLSFEKIILRYNMRCKGALVSSSSNPNQGCGEWDYSCNTFLVDSSKIEEVLMNHPRYTVSNFAGDTFYWQENPLYNYYQYELSTVSIDSILSEQEFDWTNGSDSMAYFLNSGKPSGRFQFLLSANELSAAGLNPGNLTGMILYLQNTGGNTRFLKIRAREIADTLLSASNPVVDNFTEVFFDHYSFTNGENRLQFSNPISWSGTGSIAFDFAYTNSQEENELIFLADSTTNKAIYVKNPYSVDLSQGGQIELDATHLSSIAQSMSLSFWVHGHPDFLPANTTFIYGYSDNANNRQLNLHLPWSNGSIYFDCGYNNGYNRIQKAASPNEYKGEWNHWVFMKDATAGIMQIYLNGQLWHSGSGMYNPISLLHVILGSDANGNNNFKGRVKELSFWDTILDASTINEWMNRSLNETHPNYSHLMAYYPFSEGSGNSFFDEQFGVTASGQQVFWQYERGETLGQSWTESLLRPNLSLIQGEYLSQSTSYTSLDSIAHSPRSLQEWEHIPATPGSLADDEISLLATQVVYEALPQQLFDGSTDSLLNEWPVSPQNTLIMENLSYYRRFPFYNELLSFVTPYGIGLNLGSEGKTWYFDVSDFAPLLTGEKRFMMTGGVWQEELDIDFLFIVGTPTRDVIEFNQLWQGQARLGQASIAQINQDIKFAPVVVEPASNAEAFKIRATITGHGSEGEFHQNGGEVVHYLNFDGGNPELEWTITEECSFNPIYPQGGTWVYDRQGWCPGQVSLTREWDLGAWVSPGTPVTIDYHCQEPPVTGGDYRYIAAIQLVSYGEPNHNRDARIVDILAPTNRVLHSRENPICANPVIAVQNTGAETISSLEIAYWLNDASEKQTYTWTGTIDFLDTVHLNLPIGTLWLEGLLPENNQFRAEILSVNGSTDDYAANNYQSHYFLLADVLQNEFIIEFRTNNNPSENSYRLLDDAGNILIERNELTEANASYLDTVQLNGCYTFIVEDTGNDGLNWWANPDQGSGSVRFKRLSGTFVKNFERDFGGGFVYHFSTESTISAPFIDDAMNLKLYPNPASRIVTIEGSEVARYRINWFNVSGKEMAVPMSHQASSVECDISQLPAGAYYIRLQDDKSHRVETILVQP